MGLGGGGREGRGRGREAQKTRVLAGWLAGTWRNGHIIGQPGGTGPVPRYCG